MSDHLLLLLLVILIIANWVEDWKQHKKAMYWMDVAFLWRELRSAEFGLKGEPGGYGYWHDEVERLKAELRERGERP